MSYCSYTVTRKPGLGWLVGFSCTLAGAALLILTESVTGQHRRGHWVPPAKTIGALLLVGGVYIILWAALARANAQGAERLNWAWILPARYQERLRRLHRTPFGHRR